MSQIYSSQMKVEHIGIAVADLAQAEALYAQLLKQAPYKREEVASEAVLTSFFQAGETKIELLEGTTPDSVISRYVAKKGPGLHHVAYEVADIHAEMDRLRESGIRLLNEEPKAGADNKWVCFLHPKDCGGVLIELCQDRGE
ncbi:MAG: methylmalonyl-CoA epimerase [Bacteroidota bacterium]